MPGLSHNGRRAGLVMITITHALKTFPQIVEVRPLMSDIILSICANFSNIIKFTKISTHNNDLKSRYKGTSRQAQNVILRLTKHIAFAQLSLSTHISSDKDSQSLEKVNEHLVLLVSLSLERGSNWLVGRMAWESVAREAFATRRGSGLVRHWTWTVADV